MDFSRKPQVTAKRATDIRVVALGHVLLGGAFIYALHATVISKQNSGPVIVTHEVSPQPSLQKKPEKVTNIDSAPAKHEMTIE